MVAARNKLVFLLLLLAGGCLIAAPEAIRPVVTIQGPSNAAYTVTDTIALQWQSTVGGTYVVVDIGPDGSATTLARGEMAPSGANTTPLATQGLPFGTNSVEVLAIATSGLAGSATTTVDIVSNGTITFTPTLPVYGAQYYGSHDLAKRTLTFTTDADSVDCSHDNGATFGPCDSPTSVVFALSDYASGATLQVRAKKLGVEDYVYRYDPQQLNPNLNFFACTAEVSASEGMSVFNQRLNADNLVICLDGNVNITTDTVSSTAFNHNGIRILGVEGAPAHWGHTAAKAVFQGTSSLVGPAGDGGPSLVIAHVTANADGADDFDPAGSGGHMVLSDVNFTATNFGYVAYVYDVNPQAVIDFQDSTLDGSIASPNTANQVIFVDGNTDPNFSLKVTRSNLHAAGGAALAQYTGTTTIASSTLIRDGTAQNTTADLFGALDLASGACSILNSQITSAQTGVAMSRAPCTSGKCSGTNWQIILDTVTLSTHQDGLEISTPASPLATLTINSTTVKRIDTALAAGFGFNLTSGSPLINSLTTNNTFCRQSATIAFGVLKGTTATGSSFNASDYVVDICP
jgi:hypothetical protein